MWHSVLSWSRHTNPLTSNLPPHLAICLSFSPHVIQHPIYCWNSRRRKRMKFPPALESCWHVENILVSCHWSVKGRPSYSKWTRGCVDGTLPYPLHNLVIKETSVAQERYVLNIANGIQQHFSFLIFFVYTLLFFSYSYFSSSSSSLHYFSYLFLFQYPSISSHIFFSFLLDLVFFIYLVLLSSCSLGERFSPLPNIC